MHRERRDPKAWKLRIYVDALKDAKAMTDEEWMRSWIESCDANSTYVSRSSWIAVLEIWTLLEADALLRDAA